METRVLRYFLTVAKLGSISAAARELHLSQPTLSRQIRQLETDLNVQLFSRQRKRMYLTKPGIVYREKIQQVLKDLDQANQIVATINNDDLTGKIKIGCVESEMTKLIIPQIVSFYKKYPHVQYDFYDADGEDIEERLDQGILDFGLVCAPINTAKYHTLKLPIKDRWGLLVKNDSQIAEKKIVTAKDLLNLPLITPHRDLFFEDLNEIVDGKHLQIVAESNLLTNACYLVQEGVLAISFVLRVRHDQNQQI